MKEGVDVLDSRSLIVPRDSVDVNNTEPNRSFAMIVASFLERRSAPRGRGWSRILLAAYPLVYPLVSRLCRVGYLCHIWRLVTFATAGHLYHR